MGFTYDGNLGDPILLAKMDKLREEGISEYIPLPQVRKLGSSDALRVTELPL